MSWFSTEFEKMRGSINRYTELVLMDETLRNFYDLCNYNFEVNMNDKSGNYGLLFRVLTDAQD